MRALRQAAFEADRLAQEEVDRPLEDAMDEEALPRHPDAHRMMPPPQPIRRMGLEELQALRENPQINPHLINRIIERRALPQRLQQNQPEEPEEDFEEVVEQQQQEEDGEGRRLVNADLQLMSINLWSHRDALLCLMVHQSTSVVLLAVDESRFSLLHHLFLPTGTLRSPDVHLAGALGLRQPGTFLVFGSASYRMKLEVALAADCSSRLNY